MSDQINIALNKPACQSSLSPWSKPHESAFAVNGKRTGEFSFHTEEEPHAWWQVDLEEIFPLFAIVVYNRGPAGSELADRAKSMVAFVSADGMQWQKVYFGGVSFGGVLDNSPLTINCAGKAARFVRLQLEEKNYLHLDQVEIFTAPAKSDVPGMILNQCYSLGAPGSTDHSTKKAALKPVVFSRRDGAMRILLVLCRQTILGSYHLPVGIGYISACLKQAGHTVRMVNPNHSRLEIADLLTREIQSFEPDIFAIGGMAFHHNEVNAAVKLARSLLPNAAIIAGGPLITAQPTTILKGIPELDFGVAGEGEFTMVALVNCIQQDGDFSAVQGIAYRDKNDLTLIRETPRRAVPDKLDDLPMCDYEGLGLDVYASLHRPGECAPALVNNYATRVMPLLTSRGCPYSCTFCCHEAAGRCYRLRSLDSIFAEIKHAIATWGINALFIYDDLFCLKRERLEEFCRRIAPLNLRWECSMTAGQIKPDLLDQMRESGCRSISIGVESMSQKVLTSMRKHTTKAQLEEILPMAYVARIGLWSNLIFGDPAETLETITESLEWLSNNPQYNLRTAWIGYHPGAQIYDEAMRKGLIGDPIEYLAKNCSEINSTTMTDEQFSIARFLVDRAVTSFGHAGKFLEIFSDEAGNNAARCVCPYCGEQGICHTIDGRHNLIASINCPACNRAYRVPLVVRYKAPETLAPMLERARALLSQNLATMAIEKMAKEILSTDPCNTFGWRLLIQCADASGDKTTAARFLEQLIYVDPYNPELFESMAGRLAELQLETLGRKYAKKAQHLRSIGIDHTEHLDLTMSPEQLEMTIKQQLNLTIFSMSFASFAIGKQMTKASSELPEAGPQEIGEISMISEDEMRHRKVLETNPTDFVSQYSLGVIAFAKNDFGTALEFFEKAKEVQPGFVPLLYNAGLTLSRLARYQEALDNLDQALSLDPGYEAARSVRQAIADSLKSDIGASGVDLH